MKELDKLLIKEVLGETKDNILIKACSLIINGMPEEIDMNQIKLTGRAEKLLKFANEFKMAKKAEYALDNKYFPLTDIAFSVSDFETNYLKLRKEDRVKVASILKERGGDGLAIRFYTGDQNLQLKNDTIQKLATASLSDDINYIALKALNSGDWKAITKVAEYLEASEDQNPIYSLFTYGLKKEAEKTTYKFNTIKQALGETVAKQLFKNGKLDEKMFNALPKPDIELVKKYASM